MPTIEAEKGDTVVINVRNKLHDWVTTLHAHGLYQNGTGYQDGAPGVTEWYDNTCIYDMYCLLYHSGIPPGASRTYEYNLGDQTGTYWIHGHVDVSIQAHCL